ncbi:uncharacterized protein J7T54_005548 [Emericellopsis cladophorae]|uniref:Nuclear pore complex protein Nup85 n=1 Tax=Emericellopsis cladophorae TaxID=2686198 RepID=A0A9P9Y4R6_9HYPO|nr:uncharacterized protein J7T54_005548 [Emericellopsis cladophorae]KAI6783519.1 hypothetical protein J7T54_005548 [Emericellopsis cladophorae]
MASRFIVPDSSPPSSPSTPAKTPKIRGGSVFGHPSTTPAGPPPPSSAGSFTPAGAPSDSYLGSSIMRGVTSSKPVNFGDSAMSQTGPAPGRKLWGTQNNRSNAPLGRSIRNPQRQPSGLSRQFSLGDVEPQDDNEEAVEEDAEGEEDVDYDDEPRGLFRSTLGQSKGGAFGHSVDDELDQLIEQDLGFDHEEEEEDEGGSDHDEGTRTAEFDMEEDAEGSEEDIFMNLRHDDRQYGQAAIGEADEDLMMLNTPAATKTMRKEAQDLLRRSSMRRGSGAGRAFEYGSIAKDFYAHAEVAPLSEPNELILKTEDLVCRLYNEGIGADDDAEKLDNSLANISYRLVKLWSDHVNTLEKPQEELAGVGPGSGAQPFEKAQYVSQLLLRLHHTRFMDDSDEEKIQPLSGVLLHWLHDCSYDPHQQQVDVVMRHKPSPASHSVYWQTVQNSLLRGDVQAALGLLRNAGWEQVRNIRRERVYTGQALEHVKAFTQKTCELLEQCPSESNDWDIFNSRWTLFRIQARGALDKMTLFAEGQDQTFADHEGYNRESLSTMARKATSKLPWDIYENLQIIHSILLGDAEAILGTAEDWCEATVGMVCWWDQGNQRPRSLRLTQSQSLQTTSKLGNSDEYFQRLADSFHTVLQSDLIPNAMSPVEVAVASVFENNVNAAIGILRTWSLPLACAVAEVAALGGWLPPVESTRPLAFDALDMEDLALLNISQPGPEEMLGMKDDTLEKYARDLAGIEQLSPRQEGWEMAIQVLGRMDLPEKSEQIVGELLKDILETLDEHSGRTVDKMWGILNDLGMINYAEETAETFADTLSTQSHRYGEALWYYALSHRTDKVREVLNLLMSYSLVQSTAYPATKDLDKELRNLLENRTETLEQRAKQDLEAAQLLGRMLSGYATLRKFYELRDQQKSGSLPANKLATIKRQAASALVAVVSSADDNIRGGLYDESRDAVVSEDFLLALLGEATVFVNQRPAIITLEQMDILLKAIEDIQTVGSRIYDTCDEFFNLVLSSAQGLKGSTPADLLRSTSSLSGGSYVMTGSSVLANHMHKSVSSSGGKIQRGWDWRKSFSSTTKAEHMLRGLRLGLAKDLATLWLDDADGVTRAF